MKSTISKIVDNLNDGFGPIFEELSEMMLKIKTEKNQVEKAYNFLKMVSEGHNKVIHIKINLMGEMSEFERFEEIKEVKRDLIRNNIDLSIVPGLTKRKTLENISNISEMKKGAKGKRSFPRNLSGCEGIKKNVMKSNILIGNGSHSEALNVANSICEKIKCWKENTLHVTIRNYKADCLIGLEQFENAEMIIMENLRLHGNNIVARILQLKALARRDEWMDIRRFGSEAGEIIQKVRAPKEGFVITEGYKMMLNKIKNYVNNKIDGTDWREPNGNGYIFEDVRPFKRSRAVQRDLLK
jgi:hypothetical protein